MKYLNALNLINGLGPQKMKRLMEYFGSAEAAWQASSEELLKSGVGLSIAEKLAAERKNINPDAEWDKLNERDIRILTIVDSAYPALLKEIPSAPYILYAKGSLENMNSQPMLAIVGSRKYSSYGKQAAYRFAYDLTRAGIIVVSGLALGIDAIAHQGALEANGTTIAVLGNSLEDEMIAPRTNFQLSQEIIRNGLLVSDYPLGIPSIPTNFPARNRLMAGMTLGTLVIEAAEGSGSLITANLALEFNREVFAVPGSIFSPVSAGTNSLIKSGAKPVANIKDILEELQIEEKQAQEQVKKIIPASPEEEKILKILSHEPINIDKIIKLSKLETSAASSTLSIMEMKGMVKNIGGQNYVICQ